MECGKVVMCVCVCVAHLESRWEERRWTYDLLVDTPVLVRVLHRAASELLLGGVERLVGVVFFLWVLRRGGGRVVGAGNGGWDVVHGCGCGCG